MSRHTIAKANHGDTSLSVTQTDSDAPLLPVIIKVAGG